MTYVRPEHRTALALCRELNPMIKVIMTIFVASLTLAGCARQQSSSLPDLGGPSGIITWSASIDMEKPIPGIDQASIYHAGTIFVAWGAFDGGASGSSSGNTHGVKGRGHLGSRDDEYVEFQFETKDGKTGTVTINESKYDLKNGGLFLVSAHGDQLQVEQLKRDMHDLKFDRESLQAFARNDAEIMAFFTGK
jgi:hypothetical protein